MNKPNDDSPFFYFALRKTFKSVQFFTMRFRIKSDRGFSEYRFQFAIGLTHFGD